MITRSRVATLWLIMVTFSITANAPENYDSGKARMLSIMTHADTGIGAYNRQNVQYAETQNLAQDVNIPKIAEFIGCKTLMGRSFVEETLQYPVSPKDKDSVLIQRQNVIKALVENPDFKQEIEELLTVAQQQEQEVITLMSDFFKGQTCPELANLELIEKQNPKLYPFVKFMIQSPKARLVSTALALVGLPIMAYTTGTSAKTTYQLAAMGSPYTEYAVRSALLTAYVGTVTGFSAYGVYKDYSTGAEKRTKMHALNQLITIAEKIEKLCLDSGVKNQFNMSAIQDADGVELVEGLKHVRYKDKNTKLFLTPSVHTFLYKVYQQDKHLAKIFACIAEMDAYNALANKILASKNEHNKFCFTTFVESEKPMMNATGFWNVLVPNPVVNTIREDKHILLTGPNKGGKTTAIRALLQNVILGQTFGVAAAEQFKFTMFDVIHSYLNISDDLINGLSLFASELKRAQDILERIKTLEPQKKFFFALDELFTGTVSEDGEVCAYEYIKRIQSFEGIQFIYATHFNKLKELGVNNQRCTNYKVDAPTKGADQKLVYPFTLSQGASDSRVALDLAREANLFA